MTAEKRKGDAPAGREEKDLSFEEALAKLEGIVSAIESGEIPLEESIEKYAEGTRLVRRCREILDRAEEKIRLLGRGEDGSLEVTGALDEAEAGEG